MNGNVLLENAPKTGIGALDRFVELVEGNRKSTLVEFDCEVATDADHVVMIAKPTEGLDNLCAAARALYGDLPL